MVFYGILKKMFEKREKLWKMWKIVTTVVEKCNKFGKNCNKCGKNCNKYGKNCNKFGKKCNKFVFLMKLLLQKKNEV